MAKKLAELLAVEQQLKLQAATTLNELKHTFEKKRHLFEAKKKTFTPIEDGAQPTVEEESTIQSTVRQELKWIADIWTKPLDTMVQVEETNTKARADVTLDDGTVLLASVPATALMQLEKRAGDILGLLKSIPTLDPAKGFTLDATSGKGHYVAREVPKNRTKKVQQPLVKYHATEQHPAQVEVISVDVTAGRLLEQEWSGLITPAEKGELIERAEEVQRAIKQALSRANQTEVSTATTVASKLFGYIVNNGSNGNGS